MAAGSEGVGASAWAQAKAVPTLAECWPLEGPGLHLLAAALQSQACEALVQEGTLEKQASTLISQARNLRPEQAQGEPEDIESEAPLPCSLLHP